MSNKKIENLKDKILPNIKSEQNKFKKSIDNDEIINDTKADFDEYTDIKQKKAIKTALSNRIIATKLRIFLMFIVLIAAVFIDILPQILSQYFVSISQTNALLFAGLNAGLVILTALICLPSVINGIRFIVKPQCQSDTICVVPLLAALIQTVILFTLNSAQLDNMFLLAPYVVVMYIFNLFGKLFAYNRMFGNFTYLSSQKDSYALKIIDSPGIKKEISHSFIGQSIIAGSSGVSSYDRFIELSSSADRMEISGKRLSLFIYLAGLIVVLVTATAINPGLEYYRYINMYCMLISISIPLAGMISGQAIIGKQSKKLRKKGALLSGYAAVKHFSDVNAVIFDAAELYPKDTVTLVGIKTFSGERIDQALSDAAALVLDAKWPLAPIFDSIIDKNRSILPKIDSTEVISEHGIAGWVNGRRIIIGSGELMSSFGIVPPSKDFEDRYRVDDQKIVYLASKGELTAMFVVSYEADADVAQQLNLLSRNGLSIIVRTSDPNVTAKMMAKNFKIPKDSIKILSEQSGQEYDSEKARKKVEPAYVSHKGKSNSMLESIIVCKKLYNGISLGNTLQLAGTLLTFLLMSFLMLYSGKIDIQYMQLLLYQLFWFVVLIAAPHIKTL